MKKKIISIVCALAMGSVGVTGAFAHEFFVMPDEAKAYKAGDMVQIDALSTHYFTVGEEIEPVDSYEVYPVKNGVKGDVLTLTEDPERVWYETKYKLTDNTPVIIVGNRKGGYYCLFTDGSYADGTKKEVQALPSSKGKTIAKSRYFAKYSKLYLNPSASDKSFSTPLGQELEVVPLTNPASIKKGSKASFRILYNGKPLANEDVQATYDYYNYKKANAFAQTAKTDAKGEVTFKIDQSGIWLVRVSDTRQSTHPDTDEDNISAIAVFTVK